MDVSSSQMIPVSSDKASQGNQLKSVSLQQAQFFHQALQWLLLHLLGCDGHKSWRCWCCSLAALATCGGGG